MVGTFNYFTNIAYFLGLTIKKDGLKEGLEKGLEKGHREECFKTARNLKQAGIAFDVIALATGLSDAESNDDAAKQWLFLRLQSRNAA